MDSRLNDSNWMDKQWKYWYQFKKNEGISFSDYVAQEIAEESGEH